jgi:two-component system CheB/CheR fusion protein
MWNHHATELWGLRLEEIHDRSFMGLDIGLPVEQLRAPIVGLLNGESAYQEIVLDAINRRGRAMRCRVTCAPLLGADHDVQGVILLMEEWDTHA